MKRIADQLLIKYDWYVCITRGGMQPCLDLAEITNQDSIDTLNISSYKKSTLDKRFFSLQYKFKNLDHLSDKTVLLIDDLVDTGDTLKFAVNFINVHGGPRILHTAVIYVKPCTKFLPDFYIEDLPDNDYIIFPWELSRKII